MSSLVSQTRTARSAQCGVFCMLKTPHQGPRELSDAEIVLHSYNSAYMRPGLRTRCGSKLSFTRSVIIAVAVSGG